MSVDIRLQHLWKPGLGDAEPPLQQQYGAIEYQPQAGRGSDARKGTNPARVGIPVGPHGPQSPTTEQEAREERAECRDRWRLRIEIATAVIGMIGLAALVVTLDQARIATEAAVQSAVTARRQLELSERPWITATVTMTSPFSVERLLAFEVSLKNVGHSVATDISVEAAIILYPHPDTTPPLKGPDEIDVRREHVCGEIARMVTPPEMGKLVLFPEEHGTIKIETSVSHSAVESRTLMQPPDSSLFIEPILIGCVTYLSTVTARRHATGFTYILSSIHRRKGYLRVDDRPG